MPEPLVLVGIALLALCGVGVFASALGILAQAIRNRTAALTRASVRDELENPR